MKTQYKLSLAILGIFLILLIAQPGIVSDPVETFLEKGNNSHVLADGEGWLSGFKYRMKLSFFEVGDAGTNYQIMLDVNYNSDGAATNSLNTGGHCQTDFGDIRFTDNDGSTELSYWMEEYTASDDATIWVKVTDSLSLGQNVVIYCYYGTVGTSTTTSNGDNTFIFFDDFENADFNRWDVAGSGWSIKTDRVAMGTYSAFADGMNPGMYTRLQWNFSTIDYGIMIHYWENVQVDASIYTYVQQATISQADYGCLPAVHREDDFVHYNPIYGYQTYVEGTQDDDTWWRNELGINFDDSTAKPYVNRVPKTTRTLYDYDGNEVTSFNDYLYAQNENGGSEDWWFDDYYVRKWEYYQPYTVTSLNDEETSVVTNDNGYVDNPDDTNNLYAKMRNYDFVVNLTMLSGYGDVDYVLLSWKTGESTDFTLKYDQDLDQFSKLSGSCTLVTGSCDATGSGSSLDLTFVIEVAWNGIDGSSFFLDIDSYDDLGGSDADEYGNYDQETRLDYSTFSLNDGSGTADRGDYNTEDSITASGTVVYYGTSTNPPNDEVDIWVSCGDVAGSPWSDLILDSGAFSMTVDSDDQVGLDTYTFKAVEESAGSGGTDLLHTTHTDTYIADRLRCESVTASYLDYRIDVGTQTAIIFTIHYEYDDSFITGSGGTWTIEGKSATHGEGTFIYIYEQYATVQAQTYNEFTCAGDDTHGLTAVNQNGKTATVIWDRVQLTLTSDLSWTLVGTNTTLRATGVYEYDSTSWSGSVTWTNQYPSESVAGAYEYGVSVISSITDDNYDLTVFTVVTNATCTFDDILISSVAYYWVQYSPDQVWLIWNPSTFTWAVNSSAVQDGIKIQAKMNGTSDDFAITSGGTTGDLAIGTFNPSWYYVNISIHAQPSGFDWIIWTRILSVDILHSLHIENFEIEPTDYYFWIAFQTNLNNASIAIWDDAIDPGLLYTNAIYTSAFEGFHSIARSTIVGTHNVTICINSDGETYGRYYNVSDWVWWYNWTYVVQTDFVLTWEPSIEETKIAVSGYISKAATWEVFYDGSASASYSGSIASGYFDRIEWTKHETPGYHSWKMTFTNGTETIDIGGVFYTYQTNIDDKPDGNTPDPDLDWRRDQITWQNIMLVIVILAVVGTWFFPPKVKNRFDLPNMKE